jgi:hypothetical protein
MDQVKLDHESLYHPSMFQSIPGRMTTESSFDDKWKHFGKPSVKKDNPFIVGGGSDRAYKKNELEYMMRILKPKVQRTDKNIIPTLLFSTFFSERNVEILQGLIIKTVHVWSSKKYNIGKQSEVTLLQIIDEVYEDYAQHVDELSIPRVQLKKFISKEVLRLNELLVDVAVPIIINGVEQHKKYLEQSTRIPVNLITQSYTGITGTKEYRSFDDLAPSVSDRPIRRS